jgi:hypothetical protein
VELATAFHEEVLDLGVQALRSEPEGERGFFSSTMTISKERLPEAKEAVRRFRKEFEQQFEKAGGDGTLMLNTQLFLVAK